MKRTLWGALLVLAALLLPVSALAEEAADSGGDAEADVSIEDGVTHWLDKLELGAWDAWLAGMPEDVRALWEGVRVSALVERIAATGELPEAESLLTALMGALKSELAAGAGMLAALVGLAVLSGLIRALAGEGGGAADTAAFVLRCFCLSFVLACCAGLAADAVKSVTRLTGCMELALPALFALLSAVGGAAGAGVLQPAATVLCGTVAGITTRVVVPLALVSGALSMLDQLTGRARLSELAALFKQGAKWLLGALSTLYIGSTAVRGMAAAAYDGVSVRTAKYAAGSLLPISGGMLSGTIDTLLSCAALVKNAAGIVTMLLAASCAVLPLVKLLASMLLFRAAAAVAQPVAEEKLPKLYAAAADLTAYLFAAGFAVALMFIITAALATGMGSLGL